MTDADMDDLEAFLRTLTDEDALPAIVGNRMTRRAAMPSLLLVWFCSVRPGTDERARAL